MFELGPWCVLFLFASILVQQNARVFAQKIHRVNTRRIRSGKHPIGRTGPKVSETFGGRIMRAAITNRFGLTENR